MSTLRAVESGYRIAGTDDEAVLEAPGGATLAGPPTTTPAKALPGFRVTVIAIGGSVTINLVAPQITLGEEQSAVVVPANQARTLTLLTSGKWLVGAS